MDKILKEVRKIMYEQMRIPIEIKIVQNEPNRYPASEKYN